MKETHDNQPDDLNLLQLKITSMHSKKNSFRNINRIIESCGQVKDYKAQGKIRLKIIAEVDAGNFSFFIKQLEQFFIIDTTIDNRSKVSTTSELLEVVILIYLN